MFPLGIGSYILVASLALTTLELFACIAVVQLENSLELTTTFSCSISMSKCSTAGLHLASR
jgi:hypothetical protein